MGTTQTTWDGLPVSDERPHGVTVVVYRWVATGLEVLLLHRAHNGPDYEGDWAWTPPAGARFPGEPVEACARRELYEEAGLALDVQATDCGTAEWHVYLAEAPSGAVASLAHDPEHDRYAWLPPGGRGRPLGPAPVVQALNRAITLLFRRAAGPAPADDGQEKMVRK